jgi:hypothetical protein
VFKGKFAVITLVFLFGGKERGKTKASRGLNGEMLSTPCFA